MSAAVVMEDTALATAEKETFIALGNPAEMTDDQLADAVVQVFAKIRDHLPYIIALKSRFEDGERDSADAPSSLQSKDATHGRNFAGLSSIGLRRLLVKHSPLRRNQKRKRMKSPKPTLLRTNRNILRFARSPTTYSHRCRQRTRLVRWLGWRLRRKWRKPL